MLEITTIKRHLFFVYYKMKSYYEITIYIYMWVKKINNVLYGYDTYKDCCENVNGYKVKLDGDNLFFNRIV
jgi:hypothetical protein